MNRKSKTGKGVAYLLATVAGTLLLPVIALIMMLTSARGHATEDSLMPDILSVNGLVDALAALAYVIFPLPYPRN